MASIGHCCVFTTDSQSVIEVLGLTPVSPPPLSLPPGADGGEDGVPPPNPPAAAAYGLGPGVQGRGLQGPQAGVEGSSRICHRWTRELLC